MGRITNQNVEKPTVKCSAREIKFCNPLFGKEIPK